MALTKDMLTNSLKKGRASAVSMLEQLSRLGGLPAPVYQYKATGSTQKPSHFFKVRFRVPAFLVMVEQKNRYNHNDDVFTIAGAGKCRSKQFAKSLAALQVTQRLEEALNLPRNRLRTKLQEYQQQQKQAKERLESLAVDAKIQNVSWNALPVDASLSAAVPASREGRLSFLRDTDGCPKAMLMAKAMTLASEAELPDVANHGNQTDEGVMQNFANIRSKTGLVPSANGALGESSYGADYHTTVRLALQSVYIQTLSKNPNKLREFVKASTKLKKKKVSHGKRYRNSAKHMAKMPKTALTFQGLVDSLPYESNRANIRNAKTKFLLDALYAAEQQSDKEESSSSFGMAKLIVEWPKHQLEELRNAIESVKPPTQELCHPSNSQQQRHHRIIAAKSTAKNVKEEYHRTQLKKRIAVFREHQHKTPLPIDELEPLIHNRTSQADVTIVCGGTGSGKTTRYPLMVSLFGESSNSSCSRMVVAQPRRLSCQAAANRVALEQGYSKLLDDGNNNSDCPIGYSIRFESRPSSPDQDRTIDFQTIGVVLATAASDPLLSQVTHLVLDEVHERNADMDLLLALAKNVQQKRNHHNTLPPLRIILMSATLDSDQWEDYFRDSGDTNITIDKVAVPDATRFPIDILHYGEKGFPVLSGIERRRQRLSDDELWKATAQLTNSITHENKLHDGSILCFLPGIDEIQSVKSMIERGMGKLKPGAKPTILILHSSVSSREQARIFERGPKIILSTNIAETSVTIPDIKFVIDPGRERLSTMLDDNRVSEHATVVGSQLITADIAKSSAKQRAGRAGRVSPGTIYRLYTKDDHDSRPAFTEPEILRMDLAQLVLRSIAVCGDPAFGVKPLGLISGAPDPPPDYKLQQAVNSLVEQGLVGFDDDSTSEDSYLSVEDEKDTSFGDTGFTEVDRDSDGDDDLLETITRQSESVPHLTQLGKTVSGIPATPRIGRMLMLGLAIRAVEPALTIAALLSVPKVFSSVMRRNEFGDRFRDSPSESCSDIIQKMEQFQKYEAMATKDKRSMREGREFAQVSRVRAQMTKILRDLVSTKKASDERKSILDQQWNENGDRIGAQVALVCTASQHVASLVDGVGAFATRDCAGTAKMHPSSVNFSHDRRAHWYVYHELRKTSSPFLHMTTAVSPLELALFSNGGTRSQLSPDMKALMDMLNWTHIADQWVPVSVIGKKGRSAFWRLKEILNHDMLNDVSRDPGSFLDNKDYSFLVDLVISALELQRRDNKGEYAH